jgi:hypothetical protein
MIRITIQHPFQNVRWFVTVACMMSHAFLIKFLMKNGNKTRRRNRRGVDEASVARVLLASLGKFNFLIIPPIVPDWFGEAKGIRRKYAK